MKKGLPKGPIYLDGKGGTLTPAQWFALTEKERQQILALVEEKLTRLLKGGHI